MHVFYIDEFGDKSLLTETGDPLKLKPGTSKFFILSAVGIRDTSRKALAEALWTVKRKHLGRAIESMPWGDSEIKGRHLTRLSKSVANGKKLMSPSAFQTILTVDTANAMIRDVALLFAQFRPVVFSVAIDKEEMLRKNKDADPVGIAYAYLNQRIALAMERLYSDESAILVADQQTEHEKYFRSGAMNKLRDDLTMHMPSKPNFKLVLDKPLWVDTNLSTWDREIIQMADIVAYSSAECMITGTAPVRSCHMWPELRACFALHWTHGTVDKAGFAVYPPTADYPSI
jgi:hypothetical protein